MFVSEVSWECNFSICSTPRAFSDATPPPSRVSFFLESGVAEVSPFSSSLRLYPTQSGFPILAAVLSRKQIRVNSTVARVDGQKTQAPCGSIHNVYQTFHYILCRASSIVYTTRQLAELRSIGIPLQLPRKIYPRYGPAYHDDTLSSKPQDGKIRKLYQMLLRCQFWSSVHQRTSTTRSGEC